MPRRMLIPLIGATTIAAIFFAAPLSAAPPAQPRPGAEQKVWTNEDLIALRSVSPIGDSSEWETSASAPSTTRTPYYPRFKDPSWYRVQLAALRTELAQTIAEYRRIRAELKSGKGGTKGLDLDKDAAGVTPESALQVLEQRRRNLLRQIDALEDLAQRNGVPPGELRQDASPSDYAIPNYMEDAVNSAPPPQEPQTEAEWRSKFAELRSQLYWAQKELNVLQRELQGNLVQYYPDPSKTLRESVTRKDINATRRKIAEKKAEVAELKQSISDLEDDLRHAGGPPGWSRD
jgi:hypothetical protein